MRGNYYFGECNRKVDRRGNRYGRIFTYQFLISQQICSHQFFIKKSNEFYLFIIRISWLSKPIRKQNSHNYCSYFWYCYRHHFANNDYNYYNYKYQFLLLEANFFTCLNILTQLQNAGTLFHSNNYLHVIYWLLQDDRYARFTENICCHMTA